MDAEAVSYVAFLIVGVALVFLDGRVIRHSGAAYLTAAYRDEEVAESVNQLVTVLFHLAVLGVLALISTIDIDVGSPLETGVARTGVTLLVLAVAHGITIYALSRVRARQESRLLQEELNHRADEAGSDR